MQSRSIVLVAALLASCGESAPRPTQTVTKSLEAAPDARLSAEITMAGGDLHCFVGDASAPALDPVAHAEFTFDWEPMRPELALDSSVDPACVRITQPHLPDTPERSFNVWKVGMDALRVTKLAVTQGVGAAEITVTGSRIESIDLRLGTGSMTVDLTKVVRSLTGHIEQNNGRMILKLPHQHGVKVHRKIMAGYATLNGVEQKDATWTSPNYAAAATKVDLDVLVFAGELEMKVE